MCDGLWVIGDGWWVMGDGWWMLGAGCWLLLVAAAAGAAGAAHVEDAPGCHARHTPRTGSAGRPAGGHGAVAARLAGAAAVGPWIRSALFVSQSGISSRLHYDHYDNMYLQAAYMQDTPRIPPRLPGRTSHATLCHVCVQVSGYKRVLLLNPLHASALYPFPVPISMLIWQC